MPVYEYYCKKDDAVFEALGSVSASDRPAKCPRCGRDSVRIMPTTFASLSRRKGLKERVPFHHHPIRNVDEKRAIAPVKPKAAASRNSKDTPAAHPEKPAVPRGRTKGVSKDRTGTARSGGPRAAVKNKPKKG